jgi:methionyl-tRNA formyltransferase
MKLVFAGTPEFAAIHLQALLDAGCRVRAVYTRPDRPSGRGRRLLPGPVKVLAQKYGIEVRQPASLRDAPTLEALRDLQPDLMVVVAYGLLLPRAVLETPRLGCINVHASLLPRWRGAAPIQWAIRAGDRETGVSIMQMDEGLDTGPVLRTVPCPIEAHDTATTLHDRLAALGARTLVETVSTLEEGTDDPVAQDERLATYARKVDKGEARLDWSCPAEELERWVRAFDPWPVAWTTLRGVQVRVWAAAVVVGDSPATPGCVTAASPQGVDVATGSARLRILRLQLPGGRPISAADFLNAHPSPLGQILGA